MLMPKSKPGEEYFHKRPISIWELEAIHHFSDLGSATPKYSLWDRAVSEHGKWVLLWNYVSKGVPDE